jgi:hypothetical protein
VRLPLENTQDVLRLREQSSKLLSVLDDLHHQLLTTLDRSQPVHANLRPAQLSASAFLDAIAEYADLVQLNGDSIAKAKATVMEVFDAMENLESTQVSASRKQ